mgnify:CR=1 FL=1
MLFPGLYVSHPDTIKEHHTHITPRFLPIFLLVWPNGFFLSSHFANLRPWIEGVTQFTPPEHGYWENKILSLRRHIIDYVTHISWWMIRFFPDSFTHIWQYSIQISIQISSIYLTCPLRRNTWLLVEHVS